MGLAAAFTWCGVLAAGASVGQGVAAPPSSIGASGNQYRMFYGEPEFRALDDDQAWPWPTRRAIRTTGRLREGAAPGGHRSLGEKPSAPSYELCGERRCLKIEPVEEVRDAVAANFPFWLRQDVEVVGAYSEEERIGTGAPPHGFGIWEALLLPEQGGRAARASELEAMIRYPRGAEGREVTLVGTFRGANLFEDLPEQTRRKPGDWVLRDGPFSIWITGKAPKGAGWALDARSRSDCNFRVRVSGIVERDGEYLYLRAKSAFLLRRAKADEIPP